MVTKVSIGFIQRALKGGLIKGFKLGVRGGEVEISHLLFAIGALLFHEVAME